MNWQLWLGIALIAVVLIALIGMFSYMAGVDYGWRGVLLFWVLWTVPLGTVLGGLWLITEGLS